MNKLTLLLTLLIPVFLSSQPGKAELKIYNQLGVLVKAIEHHQQQGKQQIIWNADGLTAGVYFCVTKTNQGTITTKLKTINTSSLLSSPCRRKVGIGVKKGGYYEKFIFNNYFIT